MKIENNCITGWKASVFWFCLWDTVLTLGIIIIATAGG